VYNTCKVSNHSAKGKHHTACCTAQSAEPPQSQQIEQCTVLTTLICSRGHAAGLLGSTVCAFAYICACDTPGAGWLVSACAGELPGLRYVRDRTWVVRLDALASAAALTSGAFPRRLRITACKRFGRVTAQQSDGVRVREQTRSCRAVRVQMRSLW
jgi:hypothetical protein